MTYQSVQQDLISPLTQEKPKTYSAENTEIKGAMEEVLMTKLVDTARKMNVNLSELNSMT